MFDFQRVETIINNAKDVIITQRKTIELQSGTIKALEELNEIQEGRIDIQSQMLQLMELRLKDFGYELDKPGSIT